MTIRPDEELHNADWTKHTWDLWRNGELVETLEDLEAVVEDIEAFLRRPSAEAMPEKLRRQIENRSATKHLQGKHNQSTHGHGKVNIVSTANMYTIQHVFGRDVSPKQIAALAGAPEGSTVRIQSGSITTGMWEGTPKISITYLKSGLVEAQRHVIRDLTTEPEQIILFNDDIEVASDAPAGTGTKILYQQVREAQKLGVSSIKAECAGGPGSYLNGYYTWARLGYNSAFQFAGQEWVPEKFRNAVDLHDLMARPGAAAWWKANGRQFKGTFDLSPGSKSVKILEAYVRERGWD